VSIYISFDDIDSPRGGCTTHFTTLTFYDIIKRFGIQANSLTLPKLVRLNPDIPWKTRGNAATCIEIPISFEEGIKYVENIGLKRLLSYIEEDGAIPGHTQPGIAVIDKDEIDRSRQLLLELYLKAVKRIVSIQDVEKVLEKLKRIEVYTVHGKRGLIGALAAIGGKIHKTHNPTYELLAYTHPDIKGQVAEGELYKVLNDLERDDTFGHIDRKNGRVLVLPRGRDPVLLGLRGTNPVELIRILDNIKGLLPPINKWIIYKTNQATNIHFYGKEEPYIPRKYEQHRGPAIIRRDRTSLEGGHVIVRTTFYTQDSQYDTDLAVYSEAGEATKRIVAYLHDTPAYITGNMRPITGKDAINHEAIYIHGDPIVSTKHSTLCPRCMKRMESAGESKGYKCRICGYRLRVEISPHIHKVIRWIPDRTIQPPSHQRHLTRPLKLFGAGRTLEELEETAIEIAVNKNLGTIQ